MRKSYEWLTPIEMEPDSMDWGWLMEYIQSANTPYKVQRQHSLPAVKEIHILMHTSLVILQVKLFNMIN